MIIGLATKPSFYHATSTVVLKTLTSTISLADFAKPTVPAFNPHPFLFNGHLQTAWTVTKWSDPYPIYYGRKHIINSNDGGHFAVDFVVDEFDETAVEDLPPRTRHMSPDEEVKLGSEDSKPMLIALHGLSGGSHELYLRAVLAPLVSKEAGFTACVVNARGCALSKITTNQLFNARFTEDIRETVKFLRKTFPNRPLFAVGFSLGANILTNYLGEEGDNCVLKAAVICSNPWNLEVSSKALHRTWLGSEVYSKVMGGNLRQKLQSDTRIDVELIRKGKYLYEFDRDLTARVFGYPTVGAYYRDASSIDNLLKVRVPTFILHAQDDPIAVDEAVPYDEVAANPYCFMATTPGGGHLSWFEWNGDRWFPRPVRMHISFPNQVF
ncbi:hypothetical protein RUND412_008946 [Rhizina undulata]